MRSYIELIWIQKSGRVRRYLLNVDELVEENREWPLLLCQMNYKRASEIVYPFDKKAFAHITDKINSGEWKDTSEYPRTNSFVKYTVIAGE